MFRNSTHLASAVLALAALLVLTVPALAAKPVGAGGPGGGGGGNEGSVKVVDAGSGQESLTGNEPHVCAFYLTFDGAPDGETGQWWIVDWPPTGTGVEMVDGVYSIPSGGSFDTATFELLAGHYRVVWQAVDAPNEKHKTFWVDEDCWAEEPEDQPVDEPTDQPEDQPEDQPVDEPTDQPEDQPVDEPVDEPTDQPEDQPEDQPADEPADEPEGDVADSVVDDEPEVEEPVQEQEQPAEDSSDDPGQPESDSAPASGGGPVVDELPDTAMPTPVTPVLPGAGATIGLLLLVVAYRVLGDRGFARR
jgi:hypothetical protein